MENSINEIAEVFFDRVHSLYEGGRTVEHLGESEKVFRGRQHGVSSRIEDLLSLTIYRYIKKENPDVDFCCLVDYGLRVDGELMIPDIAIVVENPDPVLVGYIDVKTDMGYKRDYFRHFAAIREKVQKLRACRGIVRKGESTIATRADITWKTVFVSEKNISRSLLEHNIGSSLEHRDFFGLYYLSGGEHPNAKRRREVEISYETFDRLLADLDRDVKRHLGTFREGTGPDSLTISANIKGTKSMENNGSL